MKFGNVDHRGGKGRPSTIEWTIEKVRQLFQDSSSLCVQIPSALLGICYLTLYQVLHKCHFYFQYKPQNVQYSSEENKERRLEFALHCFLHFDGYSEHLSKKKLFYDARMVQINAVWNKQIVKILGTERPIMHKWKSLSRSGAIPWSTIHKKRSFGLYLLRIIISLENAPNVVSPICESLFPRIKKRFYFLTRCCISTLFQHIESIRGQKSA